MSFCYCIFVCYKYKIWGIFFKNYKNEVQFFFFFFDCDEFFDWQCFGIRFV